MLLYRVKISKKGTMANTKTYFIIAVFELCLVADQRVLCVDEAMGAVGMVSVYYSLEVMSKTVALINYV